MRERLRRSAVVGLVATTVDIVLLVALRRAGWPLVVADLAALAAAALVARPDAQADHTAGRSLRPLDPVARPSSSRSC